MGSTAVQIVTQAFEESNLAPLTSFSTSQEFPYNIGLYILNKVISEMNRQGNLYFTETATVLTYTPGTYTCDLASLGIDPKRIRFIRAEASNYWTELTEYTKRSFMSKFRKAATPTQKPTAFTKYASTLELDAIPDQDYSLTIYHFKDMPKVTATTDTFLIPERDEDLLIDNVFAYLNYRLGKIDLNTALATIERKTKSLLFSMDADAGLPRQFPASF